VTTLGHDIFNYTDPVYVNHVLNGIRYVAMRSARRDRSRAYAEGRDTPLRFR
jgi:hypothetical protein